MAEIYAQCGYYDESTAIIGYLLSLESAFTVNDFKLDPLLKPLYDKPEFQALMEKYALPVEISYGNKRR